MWVLEFLNEINGYSALEKIFRILLADVRYVATAVDIHEYIKRCSSSFSFDPRERKREK